MNFGKILCKIKFFWKILEKFNYKKITKKKLFKFFFIFIFFMQLINFYKKKFNINNF